ncbi:FepA family TonB-dependent siderophore receptor [Castellaniella sp.]|uniref:FepA family TonB-dependent siderophore receptor n=1 Tax=Castellaniella sp. TaxID=1955812 RepID=UPI002AFE217C|nr:FepA family TonB-dependent siderophore receptor [Castellaniella sp.]
MTASKVQGLALTPVGLLMALGLAAAAANAQSSDSVTQLDRVVVKAEQELKQTPGASTITSEDIQKSPPATDVLEIIRTMPGVNLTGNSSSGQRGNNRQIDIRGMGPENTLILIDGKPVSSRGSARFGWRGERDTRGDTNWVPPEQIERIEVLRGPAAARYGNGAAGGVVNIITKPPADKLSGSVSVYGNLPEHGDEGSTGRTTFSLTGPISDSLDFRLSGSAANFQGDAWDINEGHQSYRGKNNKDSFPAGREGFKNRDMSGVLSWKLAAGHEVDFEASYGRQGNIYVGDTQNTNRDPKTGYVLGSLGGETNRTYRQSYSITHNGDWNAETHTLSYFQYEQTRNTRLLEGLAGGSEGRFMVRHPKINDGGYGDTNLRTLTAHTEINRRLNWGGIDQMGTLGLEFVRQDLDDRASDLSRGQLAWQTRCPFTYTPKVHASVYSLFAEDNLYMGERWTVTPGLRFDHHSVQGNNWSPSLNLSYLVDEQWTVKAGIARAYKAPNLYQSNSGYALYSSGQGCWGDNLGPAGERGCFLIGNPDLKAETSLNKELGMEFRGADGLGASLTYFHNDYRNKVEAGHAPVGAFNGKDNVFRWQNIPRAVVQGIEGNLTWPFARDWLWSTNFTYMIESKNKETGEHLSTIPEYTINSTLDWSVTPAWSLRAKATVYGEQEGPKYDFHGQPLTGSATDKVPPYALFGLSTQHKVNKHLRVTAGVDNLFDKRIFRRGNAIGVGTGDAEIQLRRRRLYLQPAGPQFLHGSNQLVLIDPSL